MPVAVIYARVSSKEQEEEGYSIPAQLKLLREYAVENDIEIAQEYTDVETAKAQGRTAFGEMIDRLSALPEGGRIILVEKTDRLYRNLRDYVTIDELEATIHFVREGTVMSPDSHSSERFMHGIKVLMARNYIENLGEEASKGMQQKAEQGTWPTWAPVAYENVEIDGERKVAPDPEYAPILAKCFELYATGSYALDELCAMANQEGLRGRRGGKISKSVMARALQNIFYTGRFVWRGEEYQGDHEPLVSEGLFRRVQEVFAQTNKPASPQKRTYAYTGLIECAHCGCAITAEKKKRKYIYYHCTGNGDPDCPQPYIREKDLEVLLRQVVDRICMTDEAVGAIRATLKESHRDQREYHQQQLKKLQSEERRLNRKIDRAYDEYIDEKISEGFWERKSGQWRNRLEEVAEAIELHERANEKYIDAGCDLLQRLSHMADSWDRMNQAKRRELLEIVQSNLSFDGTKVVATYTKPFYWMVKSDGRSDWLGGWDGIRNWMYSPAAEALYRKIA